MSSFKCLVPLALLVLLGAASAKPRGLLDKILENHHNQSHDLSILDSSSLHRKCPFGEKCSDTKDGIEHVHGSTRTYPCHTNCVASVHSIADYNYNGGYEYYYGIRGFGGYPVHNGQGGYGGNYSYNGQRDFTYGGRAFNVGSGATSQRTAEANAKAQSAGSSEANATATAAANADGNTQAAGNVNALGGGSDPNFNQPGYNDGSGAQETVETTTNARTGDLSSGQAHAQANAQAQANQ